MNDFLLFFLSYLCMGLMIVIPTILILKWIKRKEEQKLRELIRRELRIMKEEEE